MKCSDSLLRSQMQLIRVYASLFHRLRKRLNIPVSQPLLDYAYGGEYVYPTFLDILAKEINIYNLGYKYCDKDFYWLLDAFPPEERKWETEKKDNLWVSLYINIPDWLKKRYEERKQERLKRLSK